MEKPNKTTASKLSDLITSIVKDNPAKLDVIVEKVLKHFQKSYSKADMYMESKLLKDMTLPPKALAEMYVHYSSIPRSKLHIYHKIAQKVKKRLISRYNHPLRRKGLQPVPCSEMVFDSKTRRPRSIAKEFVPAGAITAAKAKAVQKVPNVYFNKIEPSRTYDNFIDLISPYIPHINKMGFSEILETALFRITQYGDQSSLLPRTAIDREASELADYSKLHKVFRNVALADHAYLVLKHALAIVARKDPKGAASFASWLIPMCLSMDIGVVDDFRSDLKGKKTDHTLISADLFADLITSSIENPPAKNKIKPVLDAIRNHHVPPKLDEDILSTALRKANTLARQEEVTVATDLKAVDFDQWFKPSIILDALKNNINKSPNFGSFDAIFFKDIVWTHPDAIFSSVRKYAETNGIIDMRLYLSSERAEMMAIIFAAIRKAGYLDASVKENSIGHHYYINFSNFKEEGRKKLRSHLRFLTPLRTDVFGMLPTQLDKGKSGWITMIHSINRTKKYANVA